MKVWCIEESDGYTYCSVINIFSTKKKAEAFLKKMIEKQVETQRKWYDQFTPNGPRIDYLTRLAAGESYSINEWPVDEIPN